MYNATNYLRLLQSLLPKGKAWTRHEDSRLTQALEGQSEEFVRIDERSEDLLNERDTRKTLELITEHEADFGLPDACGIEAMTLTERRNILHTKLITLGQQDKQYFIDLAAALGYTITITEHQPFWAGFGGAGAPCGDQEVIFHWTVSTLLAAEIIYFMAGSGAAGDPLIKQPSLELLECTINKYKPAHTTVEFVYTGYGFGRGFSNCFNAVPWEETPHLEGCFGRGFGVGFDVVYGGCFDKGFGSGFNKIG